MKQKPIGFKDCAENEEHEHNEETDTEITAGDLEKHIEEQILAKQEFQEHMSDYERLQILFHRAKYGLIVVGCIAALGIAAYIGYRYGAYKQEAGVGPYQTIQTTTGQSYIILK